MTTLSGRKVLSVSGVGDLARADQTGGELEDLLMDRFVEMRSRKEIGDAIERFVVDENGTDQGLFHLDIVGALR